jgi:hypothetical protein
MIAFAFAFVPECQVRPRGNRFPAEQWRPE